MASLVNTNYCKAGAYLGLIKLMPKKDTLYIARLKSKYPQNKDARIGTTLINFAKKISKKMNKCGNLEVEAYNTEYGGKDPHKFYRKMGFTTKNEDMDKMLDFTMEFNIDIPPYMKQGTTMYYIPKK